MKIILSFLLTIIFSALPGHAKEAAVRMLVKRGFPPDYAEKLAVLQKRYPKWHFEPLLTGKLNSKYTWNYILHMETDDSPARSLVSGNPAFSAYFHPSDTKEYDSKCRRASRQATAYFLDPRNFLNERDIFQFRDLRDPGIIKEHHVASALKDTFMANNKLENGIYYSRYFCILGKKLNIDPLFLASRVRQEQGLAGTPLISGECGSFLEELFMDEPQVKFNIFFVLSAEFRKKRSELHRMNGLYNFFNIKASGNGKFTIYLNAMREAAAGTPEMAAQWGSPRWDKKWKALYGGALKISSRYIANYQNTLYLQKWNVDFRSRTPNGKSRNFWGQYMQHIGAAFSESRNVYQALKKHQRLKAPHRFLIPVYPGMPENPAPDPANGKCPYYRKFE